MNSGKSAMVLVPPLSFTTVLTTVIVPSRGELLLPDDAVAQVGFVIVVTPDVVKEAALIAIIRPVTVGPVMRDTAFPAMSVPTNVLPGAPLMVASWAIRQNTLHACAPPVRLIVPVNVKESDIWKIHTSVALPFKVSVPSNVALLAAVHKPGVGLVLLTSHVVPPVPAVNQLIPTSKYMPYIKV